jgi:hypothetical protein
LISRVAARKFLDPEQLAVRLIARSIVHEDEFEGDVAFSEQPFYRTQLLEEVRKRLFVVVDRNDN